MIWALALRLVGLERSIWQDEWFSIRVIQEGIFSARVRTDVHPPLYYAILGLWGRLGDGAALLRVPSVVFGVLMVAASMIWLRRYSVTAALTGGLLCATHPLLVRNSQEIRSYALLGLLTVLSFYFVSRIIDRPQRRCEYVGLGITLTLLSATHLTGAIVTAAAALFIVAHRGAWRRIDPMATGIAFAAPVVIFAAVYFLFLSHARHLTASTWWNPPLTPSLLWATAIETIAVGDLVSVLRKSAAVIGMNAGGTDLLAGATVAFLVLFCAADGAFRRSRPLLVATVAYWLAVVVYSALGPNILLPRSLLPGVVLFVAFLGVHIGALRTPALRLVCIALIIFCSLVFSRAWVVHRAYATGEDWKGYAAVLASRWEEGDALVTFPPYAQHPLRYYFRALPDEAVTAVHLDDSGETIVWHVDQVAEKGARQVFLLVRTDSLAQAYRPTLDQLTQQLRKRFGEPTMVRHDRLLLLTRYGTSND